MPAYLPDSDALTTKIAAAFPNNPSKGLPFIVGVVLLSDSSTGAPLAIMDAAAITGLRTAAGSAASTRALARSDARILTILGTGVQADTHLAAISDVAEISEARIVGRTPSAARDFVARRQPHFGFNVVAFDSAQKAIDGADIVVTATTAPEPIVQRGWFAPGAHVCAIGSHAPGKRELDTDSVAGVDVLTVDTKAGALAEAGDLQIPIAEGRLVPERVVELGSVLNGDVPGRVSPQQVTVYKSVGMAAMDAAAARLVYDAASASGIGVRVDF